jgi:predicted MPP superfamily phosphohydrolase
LWKSVQNISVESIKNASINFYEEKKANYTSDKLIFKILNNGLDNPDKHQQAKEDFEKAPLSLFLDSAMRFFREFVIPEMRSRGVDTLIHAGDMFDNRSSIDIKVLNEVFRLFRDDLEDFQIYCIVGNHDTVYKNSIEVNSVETLRGFPNVHVVSSPVMVVFQQV